MLFSSWPWWIAAQECASVLSSIITKNTEPHELISPDLLRAPKFWPAQAWGKWDAIGATTQWGQKKQARCPKWKLQAPKGLGLSLLIDLLLAVLFSRLFGLFIYLSVYLFIHLFIYSFIFPHLNFRLSFPQWILKIHLQYARPHPKGSAKQELRINIYF